MELKLGASYDKDLKCNPHLHPTLVVSKPPVETGKTHITGSNGPLINHHTYLRIYHMPLFLGAPHDIEAV